MKLSLKQASLGRNGIYGFLFPYDGRLRAEAASWGYWIQLPDGRYQQRVYHEFYTLRAFLVHYFAELRRTVQTLTWQEKLAFGIPAFVLLLSPKAYLMPLVGGALAFDAGTGDSVSSSTSDISFAHTCTGSNRGAVSFTMFAAGVAVDAQTYNGVSLTEEVSFNSSINDNFRIRGYSLIAPASGSNTFAASLDGSTITLCAGIISFSDANQLDLVGVTSSGESTSATTFSFGITTGTNNSFIANCAMQNATSATITATGSNTRRFLANDANANTKSAAGCTQPAASAGSFTNSWSSDMSSTWWGVALEVKEFVAVSGKGRMSMGIGG